MAGRSDSHPRAHVCGGRVPATATLKFVSPGFLKPWVPRWWPAARSLGRTPTTRFPVAMISEGLARELLARTRRCLGKRIQVSTKDDWRKCWRSCDMHDDGVNKKPPTSVYWPLLQAHFESDDIPVRRDVASLFVVRAPARKPSKRCAGKRCGPWIQFAARRCAYFRLFLQEIDGAHKFHLDHARRRWKYGAAARCRGHLRK